MEKQEVAKMLDHTLLKADATHEQLRTVCNEAKQYGFDVSKVTKDVETDCSALVRVCVNYAGITIGSFRTTKEASILIIMVPRNETKASKFIVNVVY